MREEVSVIDKIAYMEHLYTTNLISASDYQDYLKIRLNDVFTASEQALIWDKINRWKKHKEEWY